MVVPNQKSKCVTDATGTLQRILPTEPELGILLLLDTQGTDRELVFGGKQSGGQLGPDELDPLSNQILEV